MSFRKKVTSLFSMRKTALQTQVLLESFHSLDYDLKGGDAEELASAIFARILKEEKNVSTCSLVSGCLGEIERSRLFGVISRMPKGALLHTHGIATGPFEALVDCVRADPRVYMFTGEDSTSALHGEIRYLSKSEAIEFGNKWVLLSKVPREKVLDLLKLPANLSREARWPVFQNIWLRVRELSDCLPLWDGKGSFFWRMLERLLETGVTYVEVKQLIPVGFLLPASDGKSIKRDASIDDFMKVFIKTVELFKVEHPTFSGAKMIWCSLKILECDAVERDTATTLRLMKAFPGYIAGFDLVGHEDTLSPISKYHSILAKFREQGGRLILHAGETLEADAEQMFDAIALGAARIGHAYALPKFPALMRIVRDKGITVECCPVSNQSLGYVDDLRNHPGLIMLNNGIRLTISSDDAAIFGYSDLSIDFVLVAKAWSLSLAQLKHMARQSFQCSALSHEEQTRAEEQFDKDWQLFVHDMIKRHRELGPTPR